MASLEALPSDMLMLVLSFLSLQSLGRMALLTCKNPSPALGNAMERDVARRNREFGAFANEGDMHKFAQYYDFVLLQSPPLTSGWRLSRHRPHVARNISSHPRQVEWIKAVTVVTCVPSPTNAVVLAFELCEFTIVQGPPVEEIYVGGEIGPMWAQFNLVDNPPQQQCACKTFWTSAGTFRIVVDGGANAFHGRLCVFVDGKNILANDNVHMRYAGGVQGRDVVDAFENHRALEFYTSTRPGTLMAYSIDVVLGGGEHELGLAVAPTRHASSSGWWMCLQGVMIGAPDAVMHV